MVTGLNPGVEGIGQTATGNREEGVTHGYLAIGAGNNKKIVVYKKGIHPNSSTVGVDAFLLLSFYY
jgi:hypothetical protein